MTSSAALRQEIEERLSRRVPGALTPRVRGERVRLGTGVAAVDGVTQGGFPLGAITEIGGVECSGRTTLAITFLAQRMVEGSVVAWIDATDSLDPESAAAAGVDLDRMLWVRCGEGREFGPGRGQVRTGARVGAMVDRNASAPSLGGGCGSPHPRGEGRGMPQAIGGLMGGLAAELMLGESRGSTKSQPGGNRALLPVKRKDKSIGTPGAANRVVEEARRSEFSWRAEDRVEQVPTDRLPMRRGGVVMDRKSGAWEPRCAEATRGRTSGSSKKHAGEGVAASGTANAGTSQQILAHAVPAQGSGETNVRGPKSKGSGKKPWSAIDQALRAADLLLQAGGFGVIVLDLGGVAPEVVWRIPMATWFRFRAAADRSRTCLLVLTQYTSVRSSAELVLEMETGVMQACGRVMTGVAYTARVRRQRFVTAETAKVVTIREANVQGDGADVGRRRPPQPERAGTWNGTAAWAQASGVDGMRTEAGEARLRRRSWRAR